MFKNNKYAEDIMSEHQQLYRLMNERISNKQSMTKIRGKYFYFKQNDEDIRSDKYEDQFQVYSNMMNGFIKSVKTKLLNRSNKSPAKKHVDSLKTLVEGLENGHAKIYSFSEEQ
jgi:hypothetical protein